MSSHFTSLFLGIATGGPRAIKRKRIAQIIESDSDSTSDSDSDPDKEEEADDPATETPSYRIPKKGRRLWDSKQIENLRKNFKNIENLDDNVLAFLSFRDIASREGKKDKQNRVLTEKLSENYEKVKKFPVRVEAGEDLCLEKAHDSRFLRGYVGNSQDLWVQARKKIGIAGLDPIANYETVSVGINGFLSSRVWHEVHSPSSKLLSIRMLTDHAMKSAWTSPEKGGEIKEFESIHELKMAVVALEACIKKVYWWNSSFTTVAIFLHSIEFGEIDLAGFPDRLTILANFIDEILRHNAQAWDEERYFLSAQEVSSKWSALLVRKNVSKVSKTYESSSKSKDDKSSGPGKAKEKPRWPQGVCKLFQRGDCTHTGDKHSAPWNPNYVLKHSCAKFVPAKGTWCLEPHASKDHK